MLAPVVHSHLSKTLRSGARNGLCDCVFSLSSTPLSKSFTATHLSHLSQQRNTNTNNSYCVRVGDFSRTYPVNNAVDHTSRGEIRDIPVAGRSIPINLFQMLPKKCFQEFCLFATQGKHSVNTCCHSSPAKTFGQAGRPTQTQRTHENDRGEGVSGMTGSIRHQMGHPRKTMEHPIRHPMGYKVRYPIGRQVSHCQ